MFGNINSKHMKYLAHQHALNGHYQLYKSRLIQTDPRNSCWIFSM